MQHLFPSLVEVSKLELVPQEGGRMRMARVPVPGLVRMPCRIDLQFLRPGRDTPSAVVAGAIPDREGILFCKYSPLLEAGMQVTTLPNSQGIEVVKGVFEIKEIPDVALGYGTAHHIEVKVVESVQKTIPFPGVPDDIAAPQAPQPNPNEVDFPDVYN